MSNDLPAYKRNALLNRRSALIEEHEAANTQLLHELSAAGQKRVKRQIEGLERELEEIDEQLGADMQTQPMPAKSHGDPSAPGEPSLTFEQRVNDERTTQQSAQPNLKAWFDGLSDGAKAAVITGVFGIFIAMCTLVGTLGAPVASEFAKSFFGSPTVIAPSVTPTNVPIDSITQQYTPTSKPSSTTTPELIQKSTASVFAPGEDLENNCISSDVWTPYRGKEHDIDEKGCWQLNDWGFFSQDGGLVLDFQASSKNILRGISTKISSDSRIELYMRVDQLESVYDLEPAVMFGFIPASSNDPLQEGLLLLMKLQTSGQEFAYVKLREPNNQETYLPLRYQFGDTHKITFVVENERLSLFVDGDQVGNSVVLPSSDNSFWIGYTLPTRSQLRAFIKELSVAEY